MQTSTVTVAVISEEKNFAYKLDRNEVQKICTMGSGPGGQHRNKTQSVVVLTHKPTGITVKCEDERSQHKNAEKAWIELERRLSELHFKAGKAEENSIRQSQIGCGERGDKRRTYRVQDGFVKDDITGKKASMKDVLKGNIRLLHR